MEVDTSSFVVSYDANVNANTSANANVKTDISSYFPRSRIFDLPLELRQCIYTIVFGRPCVKMVRGCYSYSQHSSWLRRKYDPATSPRAVLFVCRQIYQEADPVYWGGVVLVRAVDDPVLPPPWMGPLSPIRRKVGMIRRLELSARYVVLCHGRIEDVLDQSPGLRQLHIDFQDFYDVEVLRRDLRDGCCHEDGNEILPDGQEEMLFCEGNGDETEHCIIDLLVSPHSTSGKVLRQVERVRKRRPQLDLSFTIDMWIREMLEPAVDVTATVNLRHRTIFQADLFDPYWESGEDIPELFINRRTRFSIQG